MKRYDEYRRKWAAIYAAREAIVLAVIAPGEQVTKAQIRERAAAKCGTRWTPEVIKRTIVRLIDDGRLLLTGRTVAARYSLPQK